MTAELFLNSLQNWLSEFRIYRRDEKGRIVKQSDHLMDATRYLILSGLQVACREPREEDDDNRHRVDELRSGGSDRFCYAINGFARDRRGVCEK